VNLRWEMGNTYQQHGDSGKALEFYKQALPLAKTNPIRHACTARWRHPTSAIQNWDAAEQSNNQATSYANDDDTRPGRKRTRRRSRPAAAGMKRPAAFIEGHRRLATTPWFYGKPTPPSPVWSPPRVIMQRRIANSNKPFKSSTRMSTR
jgi:hypothetical protein